MGRKAKKIPATEQAAFPPEERPAEAVTICWMLCALFTLCAEIIGLLGKVVFVYADAADPAMARWALVPLVTLAIGLVSGTLAIALTPLVYRLRKTPPPDSVTIVVILIGLAPLATFAVQWLRG
jgi:hypothetical protein